MNAWAGKLRRIKPASRHIRVEFQPDSSGVVYYGLSKK
jgi:hypothetical protein